jgi:hypothetical protein
MSLRLIAFALLLLAPGFAPGLTQAQEVPGRWKSDWPQTDFSRMEVNPADIFSGGPPKDGIPAINGPVIIAASAEDGLDPREPVMVLELDGQPARAYPVRYLMWHEIVNDVAGDVPVAVTFCPLCNSGLIFDRRLDGRVLELGVSGMLRYSDMIMFDRQTESWWQQFQGRAIVGKLLGSELTVLPALLESWSSYLERNPDGLVMATPEGYWRDYGANPYVRYDSGSFSLYQGKMPPHGIDPVARVVRVGNRAWPLIRLAEAGEITEAGVRLSWAVGQASALDTSTIGTGREVGNVRVFDAATGADVIHEVVFAFSFQAFEPNGIWMMGE